MELGGRKLLVCNCERTMELDGKTLCAGLGGDEVPHVHSHLCRTEIAAFNTALESDSPLLIACTQEAPLFRELAEDAGRPNQVAFTNIRERAGWSKAGAKALPKIAALLAEATIDVAPAGSTTLKSNGVCLVYGAGQEAIDTARALSARLSVTLMLTSWDDMMPPSVAEFSIYKGRIAKASGHFGAFEITVNKYAPVVVSARSTPEFLMDRDGAQSACDLIFDMSGGEPLFPSHTRREGYFHVDPSHPAAVARAMFEITDLVGEFEKPLYVTYNGDVCAHSRSQKTGCSRCLDTCPASAIQPDGDTVRIDPVLCGGCGSCSAVCPTGAVSYAYPARTDVIRRAQTLLSTYTGAGGVTPVLLVHDERHGMDMIAASARLGRGLPANVIPFSLNEVTSLGHDAMASMLACGAQHLIVLASPQNRDELEGLNTQIVLTNTVLRAMGYQDGERVSLLVEQDPDALEGHLYDLPALAPVKGRSFDAVGDKRTIARTAISALNEAAPSPQTEIALPAGTPYGRIKVDTEGCTLCLACVSACPANALQDSPDLPQLRFVEQACVQCGLCRNTCPEGVISLEPRLDLTPAAMTSTILNEEEPFHCIQCGKPFGTKSTIEHIMAKLGGSHSMFRDADSTRLIQMCDDCRIETQANDPSNPFAYGERPRIRTTDDYLAAEEAARSGKEKSGDLRVEDFLIDDD